MPVSFAGEHFLDNPVLYEYTICQNNIQSNFAKIVTNQLLVTQIARSRSPPYGIWSRISNLAYAIAGDL
jgi:hypothetical protein